MHDKCAVVYGAEFEFMTIMEPRSHLAPGFQAKKACCLFYDMSFSCIMLIGENCSKKQARVCPHVKYV
uniref:Uncharacterized protein n=1 Tax=Romanomermis culicivorax TaxID=13658 RepID=A0A915HJZ5_ROMCU